MAAQVPVPTATVGNKNYFTGQTIQYGNLPYTPLYDQTGALQGFRNDAGSFVQSGALSGMVAPKIDVSAGAGGGGAAPAAGGSYLGSGGNVPQIGGQSPWRVYTNKPTTGAGAAPYDPTSYTVTSGVRPSTAMSTLDGYQVFQMGNMPVAYDANSNTFGQLQGNTYVPYSRDQAQQLGLIQQTTDPALPEQNALGMMAQIDPTGEALRQSLGQSYLSPLNQAPSGAQAPQAADVQSYLNLYKQIDPEGYAQHANLATSMDKYVQQMQQQAALGTQLDPETVREITQATRQGQVARGNVYGTPQLMQEAVTRGQAGLAIQQQRQAQLASALGQQQGYLSSGMGLGDIANTLYQQGFARNLSARTAAQQGANPC